MLLKSTAVLLSGLSSDTTHQVPSLPQRFKEAKQSARGSVGPMMEAWPTVAWVLLMTNAADWLKTVQSRDFSMTDIIRLHPSTTPHPGGFKCFTCEDAADNYECNRWAPDVYCPKDARYCSALHVMDERGASVSVTKRCVALQDCLHAGCSEAPDAGLQMCSSCCEGNICNVLVPRNASSSVFSSTSPLAGCGRRLPAPRSYFIFIIVISTARHF
ncbi:ly6/PLAUR domain-containing protein 6-like isoform X2 [Pseudoliparis swirei]|uniref:ly6/PLAUR domain-containing protein 6-like isoform X2 n=1 Tax=Pseudoliparis swirei TaxID=2059687 RepID=UPI0024BDBD44|nr:ly6/PLAUR domain-containing protein 6-like isoform X2 [Pseudoliparis swirei]